MEVSIRFFALFERCAKSVQTKRSKAGVAICLPRLLEALGNVMQYQYGPNLNLVYGLVTRQTMLRDLATSVADLCAQAESAQREAESSAGIPGSGSRLATKWWKEVEVFLSPIVSLLETVVPQLEAEVEKNDISSPEEAKELLPKCVLGLLPVPHAFAMRSLLHSEFTHWACEQCLVDCLANGPLTMWDAGADADAGKADAVSQGSQGGMRGADGAATQALKPQSGSRERSSSRRRPPKAAGTRERSSSRSRGGVQPSSEDGAASHATPASLKEQLMAASAQGVDIMALVRQLQEQQAVTAPHGQKASVEQLRGQVGQANGSNSGGI